MALIIDALDTVKNKRRLPAEAFFVDTNIIINFKDPFGASYKDKNFQKINEDTTNVLLELKSKYKAYTTLSVAQELYNYFQSNSYKVYKPNEKYSPHAFKNLRENDTQFMCYWDSQLTVFRKLLTKNFEILNMMFDGANIIKEFKGSLVDFGDHLLFNTMISEGKNNLIFSNDGDFYSYDEDFYLMTLNENIIKKAKEDKRIYIPPKN